MYSFKQKNSLTTKPTIILDFENQVNVLTVEVVFVCNTKQIV